MSISAVPSSGGWSDSELPGSTKMPQMPRGDADWSMRCGPRRFVCGMAGNVPTVPNEISWLLDNGEYELMLVSWPFNVSLS